MSETWFTSDTHLGHDFVARLRGFEDHVEHDAHLARMWDKRVRETDEVWVLGDVAMNGWRDRLHWFDNRPGNKHIILGNHDRAHPSQKNGYAHTSYYGMFFDSVQSAGRLTGGILLSHFPYDSEGIARDPAKKDRYTQWRLRDEGRPLFHGHTHDDVKVRRSALGTPMIHVGLDAWDLKPVTLHDLKDLIP